MANVVLTNICNLSCPYCFASSLRKEDTVFITEQSLDTILTFLKRSHSEEIGLIGGEPTLHPQFRQILARCSEEFRKVFVYTNGIGLEKFFPEALKENICYLINVNEKSVIGEKQFSQIERMLDTAYSCNKIGQFSLGVNVYRENQDYTDILALCGKYSMTGLRVSAVVPQEYHCDRMAWFGTLKKPLMNLYRELKANGIVPKYDCNIIPVCFFTEEEKEFLKTLGGTPNDIARITGIQAVCRPVIDIYPDLTAARCFGMCEDQHTHLITEYESLNDLIRAFIYDTDGICLYGETDEKCKECYRRKTLQCYGGCLKFLVNKNA